MYHYRLYEIVKGQRLYVKRHNHGELFGDRIVYTTIIKDAQVFESDELIKDSIVVRFGSLLHYEWIIGSSTFVIE